MIFPNGTLIVHFASVSALTPMCGKGKFKYWLEVMLLASKYRGKEKMLTHHFGESNVSNK